MATVSVWQVCMCACVCVCVASVFLLSNSIRAFMSMFLFEHYYSIILCEALKAYYIEIYDNWLTDNCYGLVLTPIILALL